MGHADYYRSGTYNGICDRCGSKFKFSDLKLEWDGLYVCTANGCWEPRQPQDYVKGVRDDMSVPISRPQSPNVFLDTIILAENSNASLIFTAFRLKSGIVNGAPLNSTTLG